MQSDSDSQKSLPSSFHRSTVNEIENLGKNAYADDVGNEASYSVDGDDEGELENDDNSVTGFEDGSIPVKNEQRQITDNRTRSNDVPNISRLVISNPNSSSQSSGFVVRNSSASSPSSVGAATQESPNNSGRSRIQPPSNTQQQHEFLGQLPYQNVGNLHPGNQQIGQSDFVQNPNQQLFNNVQQQQAQTPYGQQGMVHPTGIASIGNMQNAQVGSFQNYPQRNQIGNPNNNVMQYTSDEDGNIICGDYKITVEQFRSMVNSSTINELYEAAKTNIVDKQLNHNNKMLMCSSSFYTNPDAPAEHYIADLDTIRKLDIGLIPAPVNHSSTNDEVDSEGRTTKRGGASKHLYRSFFFKFSPDRNLYAIHSSVQVATIIIPPEYATKVLKASNVTYVTAGIGYDRQVLEPFIEQVKHFHGDIKCDIQHNFQLNATKAYVNRIVYDSDQNKNVLCPTEVNNSDILIMRHSIQLSGESKENSLERNAKLCIDDPDLMTSVGLMGNGNPTLSQIVTSVNSGRVPLCVFGPGVITIAVTYDIMEEATGNMQYNVNAAHIDNLRQVHNFAQKKTLYEKDGKYVSIVKANIRVRPDSIQINSFFPGDITAVKSILGTTSAAFKSGPMRLRDFGMVSNPMARMNMGSGFNSNMQFKNPGMPVTYGMNTHGQNMQVPNSLMQQQSGMAAPNQYNVGSQNSQMQNPNMSAMRQQPGNIPNVQQGMNSSMGQQRGAMQLGNNPNFSASKSTVGANTTFQHPGMSQNQPDQMQPQSGNMSHGQQADVGMTQSYNNPPNMMQQRIIGGGPMNQTNPNMNFQGQGFQPGRNPSSYQIPQGGMQQSGQYHY